jgi:nitric oxide dioxygenase
MDLADLQLPDDALYYLCGPMPFLQSVRGSLLDQGVRPRDVQYEVFGPDLWAADLLGEPAPGAGELDEVPAR